MRTKVKSRVARQIGRLAAVGALALLLAGTTVAPAGAMPWWEAAAAANGMIRGCSEMGGKPSVVVNQAFSLVSCTMPSGSVINCTVLVGSPYVPCG